MDAEKINATDAVRLFGGAGYMEGAIVEMDAGAKLTRNVEALKSLYKVSIMAFKPG